MKNLKRIIILIFIILMIKPTFAIEKSSINLEKNPATLNIEKNIQKARLMEMEVSTFKNKLSIIQLKYKLNKDIVINNSINELNKITFILRKIQTTRVNKYVAEDVIKIIIKELKKINLVTKNRLKKIKLDLDKKRVKYDKLSLLISKSIDNIVRKFSIYYKNKNNISIDDKKIIILLQKLKSNSNELKNFNKKNIYNITSVKKSLISILKKVRINILEIRRNFKKIKK